MLKIQENILLKEFTTFKLGGFARYFCVVRTNEDLHEVFLYIKSRRLPFFVLGGGSNLLISDKGFPGLVIKNEIKGIKFIDLPSSTSGRDSKIRVEIGSGEILDDVVVLSTMRNLFGLENLSGIPGTIGGATVQNAGAYGVEIKDILLSVEGINFASGKKFIFDKNDCQYGYRESFFKKNSKYVITAVTLELSKRMVLKLDYVNLKGLFEGKEDINSNDIREVILKIRKEKLPDWHKLGTAGSYFKNPIIAAEKFEELKKQFPEIVGFLEPKGKIKVPLAWILDKICKLKGFKEDGVGLYDKQPIILVNYGQATAIDVIRFSEKIKKIVKERTGIEIKEEVEIIKL